MKKLLLVQIIIFSILPLNLFGMQTNKPLPTKSPDQLELENILQKLVPCYVKDKGIKKFEGYDELYNRAIQLLNSNDIDLEGFRTIRNLVVKLNASNGMRGWIISSKQFWNALVKKNTELRNEEIFFSLNPHLKPKKEPSPSATAQQPELPTSSTTDSSSSSNQLHYSLPTIGIITAIAACYGVYQYFTTLKKNNSQDNSSNDNIQDQTPQKHAAENLDDKSNKVSSEE